ncbi:MAG: OsmC family protein [Methanobacteriota archaeon]
MSEMELTVRHLGKGSAMECTTPQGAAITFDDPDTGAYGGSPVQHLLSAIGACALVDVGIILRKKRLAFSDLKVVCAGTRRDEPSPRVFLDVRLRFEVSGEIPQKVFDDVVKLSVEKYCTVAGTVQKGAPVAFESFVRRE